MSRGICEDGRVLAEIRAFHAQHGRMPTMKELEHKLSRLRRNIYLNLQRLIRQGKLIAHPRGTLPFVLPDAGGKP